jgi:hypothetical protein
MPKDARKRWKDKKREENGTKRFDLNEPRDLLAITQMRKNSTKFFLCGVRRSRETVKTIYSFSNLNQRALCVSLSSQ